MNRTASLTFRLTEALRKALDRAAADDNRTVSSYVERILIMHLVKAGYWPPEE
jgi:uncharacterized protein (DUF1778 family)